MHFGADQEWLRFYFRSKINEIATDHESMNAMTSALSEHFEHEAVLSKSDDLQIIKSRCLLNLNLFRESYAVTSAMKQSDTLNIEALISHIVCLVELGKQSELYKTSHDLICAYPDHAVSWFSVGCYYYMTRRYEIR